jgi:MATE family multidrug resistance protein
MHLGVLYLFIYVFMCGLAGAAIAYEISGWIIALV